MVESYLHKMAKELLYQEIVDKGIFEFKINDVCNLPLGNHGLYMEFPTFEGDYPDELGCDYIPVMSCKTCVYGDISSSFLYNHCDYNHNYFQCNGSSWECNDNNRCVFQKNLYDRFSLKDNLGYCKCAQCEYLDKKDIKVHDIVSIHKGQVVFAIEIINKHPPAWRDIEESLNYQVFLIKAVDILKRVENTPVYVYCLMGRRCWS